MGTRRGRLPIEGNFVESERFHPAAGRRSGERQAAANVRRRLGMDAQRLSPLPRLSRRARRARRIQRQVHVQPIRAARRIRARLREITFGRPIAISFSRKNAGNLPGSGSRAIRE